MAGGFEPPTDCLEGSCSIQLSYATIQWSHHSRKPPFRQTPTKKAQDNELFPENSLSKLIKNLIQFCGTGF